MESGSLAARFSGAHWRLWALLPIVALVGAIAIFVSTGNSLLDLVGQNPPRATSSTCGGSSSGRRDQGQGHEPAARGHHDRDVTVDDAVVPYTLDGDRTIGRLRSTTVVIPFDWVDGEPLSVGVTSSTGIQTTKEVAAAVETPQASARGDSSATA